MSTAAVPAALTAMPRRALAVALGLMTVLGALPVVSALIALDAAPLLGCRIDAAAPVPCLWGAVDLGTVLHKMAIAGWFGFTTAPPAMLLLVVWLAVVLAFALRNALARKGYWRV
ncbi:MAG: hypothetical protein J0H78_04725 [Rhizobiales bacterium]|nr:hypothetical protein [Hyphomicrobiales bacterium]